VELRKKGGFAFCTQSRSEKRTRKPKPHPITESEIDHEQDCGVDGHTTSSRAVEEKNVPPRSHIWTCAPPHTGKFITRKIKKKLEKGLTPLVGKIIPVSNIKKKVRQNKKKGRTRRTERGMCLTAEGGADKIKKNETTWGEWLQSETCEARPPKS